MSDLARMSSIEEKSLRVFEFSGYIKDWDIWFEKFKAQGRRKEYTKLLLGRAEIPTQDQLITAEDGKSDGDKKVTQLGNLNELGYEESPRQVKWPSILSIISANLG